METFDPLPEGGAIIRVRDFGKGRGLGGRSTGGMLMAVLRGSLLLEGGDARELVPPGHFVFIPPGIRYALFFISDASLAFFSMERHIGFCGEFLFPRLEAGKYRESHHAATTLAVDHRMGIFMDAVTAYCAMGGMPPRLFDLKVEELFFLMGSFYSAEELSAFFRPVLSPNAAFTYFVLQNHDKARTVIELARKSSLSLSAFEKEFRRTFEDSPYRWMKRKKAGRLLEHIRHSDKPFKQISEEFGFASASQLSDFCKREWGVSPRKIRKGVAAGTG